MHGLSSSYLLLLAQLIESNTELYSHTAGTSTGKKNLGSASMTILNDSPIMQARTT